MKPSESCRFRLIGAAWGGLCRNRHDVPFEQLPFSTIWQEIVPAQTRSLRRALPEYIKKKTAAPHFGTLPIVRLAAFRSLLAERLHKPQVSPVQKNDTHYPSRPPTSLHRHHHEKAKKRTRKEKSGQYGAFRPTLTCINGHPSRTHRSSTNWRQIGMTY